MATLAATSRAATRPSTVAVIGAGYVGIPTAAMLAHFGHQVVLAERDEYRRNEVAAGRSPILEAGLDDVLAPTVASGALRVSASAAEAVRDAQFVFICVATPLGADGRANLDFIDAVANEIKDALRDDAVVVNKSTVPIGTIDRVANIIGRPGIRVVSNPEFLREGLALADSLSPDRIVVGSSDRQAAEAVAELFAPTGATVLVTDATTSELIKYASNAFLATKLSFINTLSRLCDELGADVGDLVRGVGADHRIGSTFLNPGPGWGGSCLPKDAAALVAIANDAGVHLDMVVAAIEANAAQQRHIVAQVAELAGGSLEGVRVAALGLAFKANTSDRRDSPALAIISLLRAAGAEVVAFDPTVSSSDTSADLDGIVLAGSVVDAARNAAVAVVLTEWAMFGQLDFDELAGVMAQPALYDARNLVNVDAARRAGFTVRGVGRP